MAPKRLKHCAAKPFDVVLSDARMHGMQGHALLQRVMLQYPDTVRIILSGQYQWEMALQSVDFAHQFINKPCDAWTLKSAIDGVCNVRDRFTNIAVRQAIGGLRALPSQPAVQEELALSLEDADATASEVAHVIARNVAMCARLPSWSARDFSARPKGLLPA